jgi:uncharacterized protein YcbK (DUF882 family)
MTNEDQTQTIVSRRSFIKGCLQAGILTTLPTAAFAGRLDEPRYTTNFINSHTGESFKGVYRIGNRYMPDAFEKISYALRDFRTGDVHPIDPRLIDIITSLHLRSKTSEPFQIISGYRSPKTNSMLRRTSSGVAKNSYHMKGRAIDLRIPSYSTKKLRDIAQQMKAGGVGYYGSSNFIHLDTGDVRTW